MAGTTIQRGRLRRLAELRPDTGRVLSIYFDLDPAQFATGAARASQITSIANEAGKRVEACRDHLDHEELTALREDVERVRSLFNPGSMGAGGARGIAVFACGPAGVLEVIRTPYPVETRVVIGDAPYIEPLVRAGDRERWCVVLVNRRDGRILIGDQDGLEEVDNVRDETHGQHDQGGWSQRRYEDSIEEEKRDHLEHVGRELLKLLRRRPFDRLMLGGPAPIDAELEGRLHPYLKERLAGRIQVDVESASPTDVLEAAAPVFEEHRRAREREAIERLRAGIGRGPDGLAVAGLPNVLTALNEQRVEILLLEPGTSGRGWVDPVTGYLAADPGPSPTGGELQERENVIEAAIERAIEQSAEVLVLNDQPDLGPHGGVAALLRF
jgi:peptide subunit release factor 1 (eRF1)